MQTFEQQRTARREAREGYVRYLLGSIFTPDEINTFLNDPMEEGGERSILEMIYTGDMDRAVIMVERLLDEDEAIVKRAQKSLVAIGG